MSSHSSPFLDRLQLYQKRVDRAMDQWLPSANTHPARLHEAMRYAVLTGGKRIRPTLTYATGEALGIPLSELDGIAASLELIHSYSLVHDDLPAMDDDDLRRGQPTCHKAFDEATAILVGDALQALSFYILTHDKNLKASPEIRLRMIELLGLACGSRGMAGGQAIDLESVGKELNIMQLEDMHIHKTGALIRASVALPALCVSDKDQSLFDRLDHFGKCIGLAFQIRDDILDEEGDTSTMGKQQGQDRARNKPTYPYIAGMSVAKERAADLYQESLKSLEAFDDKADTLRNIADYIVNRSH
jgi:geranylgeranyl pyrophosphate synthase